MRLSRLVFKLRVVLITILITVAFFAPWARLFGWDDKNSALVWLAVRLAHGTGLEFSMATTILIVLTILSALKGMVWRVWGTSYLGATTVYHGEMQGAHLQSDGPYRFVRNPLYLGDMAYISAVATLMPPSGAVFAIVMVGLLYLVLIDGEERFLSASLGQSYLAYCRAVPRLLPRFWRALPAGGAKPNWVRGVLSEVNAIGVFLIFAILSWRFDRMLMIKALIVCFGFSLVVRALLPRKVGQE